MHSSPIFILGAHKSGTTLLRSLLDGHPELFPIPFEPHPFQQLGYWIDNEYRKQPPSPTNRESFISNCISWIHHCNTTLDRMGDNFIKGKLNEEIFRQRLENDLTPNATETEKLTTYYTAIQVALQGASNMPESKRFVDKSVENAEFATDLARAFPNAKFIHIVRNPYANAVSLRRYKSRDFGYPVLYRLLRTMYNSYYFLYQNKRNLASYHTIRYEDLVTHPEQNLRKLCQFLEIQWSDDLTSPTLFGESWGGNSTTGKQFSGISDEHLERWKEQINPVESYYINRLFPFVIEDYDYEYFESSGSFWSKAGGENLKRYIANRLYRFYLIED